MSAVPFSTRATDLPISDRARARARVEMWYPWVGGGGAGLLVLLLRPSTKHVDEALRAALGSAVDAAAVLAGFQATAFTLLLGLSGSAVVRSLKRMRTYDRLITYHWHAILVFAAGVAVAIGLQGCLGAIGSFKDAAPYVAAFATAHCVVALLVGYRITHLMVKLLRAVSREDV